MMMMMTYDNGDKDNDERDDQILQLPKQIVKLASVFSRSSSGSVPMS